MKISAIEIGTNSTKFIIAELHDSNTFELLEKESTVNGLSKSMYGNNTISSRGVIEGFAEDYLLTEACRKYYKGR